MRRSIGTGFVFVTALALGLAALGTPAGAEDEPPGITWRTDLEAARADARESGRPLFLVFRCEP